MYRLAANSFHVDPFSVAVFEDSVKGFEAVVRAGCNLLRVGTPADIRAEKVLGRILCLESTSMLEPLVNIVVPMAGQHPEFWMNGPDMSSVETPVHLAKVRGQTGLYWTLRSLEPLPKRVRFIFLVGSALGDNAALTRCIIWATRFQPTMILPLKTPTSGAAMSVLQAKNIIDNPSPLVIFDGNHKVIWAQNCGLREMLADFDKVDSRIATFRDHDLRWSYVQVMPGSRKHVVAVKRKVAMSDMACSGLFCFRSGSCFVEAATMSNPELLDAHIAPVLDSMVIMGKRVDAYHIAGSSSIRQYSEVKTFAEGVFATEGLTEQVEVYAEMRKRNEDRLRKGFVYDACLKEVDGRRCKAIYVMAKKSNFLCFAPLEWVFSEIRQNFQGHVLYDYGDNKQTPNALRGGLHWTFMQLVSFSMFNKIELPSDYMQVVQRLAADRLREFEIRFTTLVATPNNLLLVGYPTLDLNTSREDIRERLRLMGYPLYEPYKNDIFHMTLVRFAEPLSPHQHATINRIVSEPGVLSDRTLGVLRVEQMSISSASWKMQPQELEGEETVTVILSP
jgi:hypothetical protein